MPIIIPSVVLYRCRKEAELAAKDCKDPQPSQFSRQHLESFEISNEYDKLLRSHPTLMHALAGTAQSTGSSVQVFYNCFHFRLHSSIYPLLQEPTRYGFGGYQRNRLVSTKASLALAAGMVSHIGHSKTSNTTQNILSVLLSAARVPGPLVGLLHQLGLAQR